MKIVQNWNAIAKRSHSMWSMYLGILALWMPDIIYLLADYDTSPRVWFVVANLFFAYGILGRIVDQGMDR